MKILLATSCAIPSGGGIASYNQEIVSLFNKTHEIYLLTDSNEIDVEGYIKTYSTYGNSIKNFEYCSSLISKINEANYDVVINSASSFIPIIAPFLNSRILSISHFVNGILAINAGYNSKYLNGIIALSNYGKDFLLKKFRIRDGEKVKVIYNFVKVKDDQDLSKIHRTPLRIVYPGGTSIAKSIDVIQSLIYKLLKSNLDYEFIWIGNEILPASRFSIFGLKKIHQLFKSDHRLKITGLVPREKSVELISSANIFLLPSRLEGCPISLLEAMQGGCIPVISDAHHGSREIIEKTGAGIIVHQGSSNEIFDVIKQVITGKQDFKEYYHRSRGAIQSFLSEDVWEKQMNEVLINVLNHNKESLPLTKLDFKKSVNGMLRYSMTERFKSILKSAFYRMKIDFSFFLSK